MRLLNRRPDHASSVLLAALPFVLLAGAYLMLSAARLAGHPDDRLLPGLARFGSALTRLALQPDLRSGDLLLWTDTVASLQRLLAGLAISAAIAFALGIAVGLLPLLRALLAPIIAVAATIPPLAVLPILFIVAGPGEAAKVALIALGTLPFLLRELVLRVAELPAEQMIKAQTLGGTSLQIGLRVVAPQMLPRLLDSLRRSLGPAWLLLIAAEAIASRSGLGYRIFLERRDVAMDIILPYVAWITLLAFLLDRTLRLVQRAAFPWFAQRRAA